MGVNIGHELDTALSHITSIVGLSEDVIEPIFEDWACDGYLECYQRTTGKDRRDIALEWMNRNYNVIYATNYAIQNLSKSVMDILQALPPLQEMESKEATQHE